MVDEINALPYVDDGDQPLRLGGQPRQHDEHQRRPDGRASSRSTSTSSPTTSRTARRRQFVDTVTHDSGDGLTVAVTGPLAENANNPSFSSTGLGVLLALIVLLLVFGSVFAAILPIVSALFALGTAIGIIGLLSHVIGMP